MTEEIKSAEKWRPIKGEWGQFYAVSNMGRIKSLERIISGWKGPITKKERVINPTIHKKTGMYSFRGWVGNQAKVFFIHRTVATAFLRKKKDQSVVGFKDGDAKNCTAKNLYWTTPSDLVKKSIASRKEVSTV